LHWHAFEAVTGALELLLLVVLIVHNFSVFGCLGKRRGNRLSQGEGGVLLGVWLWFEIVDDSVSYDRVRLPIGEGLSHFVGGDWSSFLAVLIDKSDNGLAALFRLLFVMGVELEGDGKAF
jgi:hypothetical protein